jgi:glycosyltransferase involved in cell wall biosynthesis
VIDYAGQSVLVIGENAFGVAAAVMENEGSLVEVMPAGPGLPDPTPKLIDWNGRKDWAADCLVQTRSVTGVTLEDTDAWDQVVLAGVPEIHAEEVLRRAQRAMRPHGNLRVLKEGIGWDGSKAQLAISEAENLVAIAGLVGGPKGRSERKVMLHVHNVRRCGGTGNFVYDMARCFPEYAHTALCVNDPAGDPNWIRDVSHVMRTMYAPQLTEALLEEINPRIVVLHATSGGKLEGEWPYPWLQAVDKRFVIRLHHIPTRPILPADLSVFVSEYVKGRYEQFLDKQIPRHIVMPPCTDLKPYAQIPRPPHHRGKVATTGGKACAEMQALMKGALSDWKWNSTPPGRLNQFAGYLAQFPFAVVWSGHQETWCRTVTEAMAAGCVVIAHRAGAIPEQIEHGVNGYLFNTGDELVKLMDEVQANVTTARLAQIAQAGREWAVKNVGLERMRTALYPFFVEALMED